MGCGQSAPMGPAPSQRGGFEDDFDHDKDKNFFDDYLLERKIGAGAFGQFHSATMTTLAMCKETPSAQYAGGRLDRAVSVKAIDMRLKSKQLRKMLRCEIDTWKSIGKHKHCAEILDVQAHSGICFIVIEKCSYGFLPYLERIPSIDEQSLGEVFAQMLVAINFLHKSDIIHRNVKPDSFLIGGDEGQVVKLCDFSLAKRCEGQQLRGECGTPLFISPEMLLGNYYTEKTDTWSFGVMVYALFFGRFPYDIDDLNSKEVKLVIAGNEEGPNFSDVPLPLTKDALDFAKSLLQRNPSERVDASAALNSEYVKAVLAGKHATDVELSNLKPMFERVRRVRSFENRNLKQKTAIDDLMSHIQKEKHGISVPGIDDTGLAVQGQAVEAPWEQRCNSLGGETLSTKASKSSVHSSKSSHSSKSTNSKTSSQSHYSRQFWDR